MTGGAFEPRFLGTKNAMRIHERQIAKFGGSAGLRDHNLLDAALAMPRQSFGGALLHPDLPAMAAAYHFHLAKNHPFIDGNKRVALAAAIAFVHLNGHRLDASNDEAYDITIALASGQLDKAALTQWWAKRIVRLDG